jgi:hypothetical protein
MLPTSTKIVKVQWILWKSYTNCTELDIVCKLIPPDFNVLEIPPAGPMNQMSTKEILFPQPQNWTCF